MFPARCRNCGTGIAENSHGDWVDHHGINVCPGSSDEHMPYDYDDGINVLKINRLKLRKQTSTYYADSHSRPKKNHQPQPGIQKIWDELQLNPPKPLHTEEDPWVDGDENLEPIISNRSSYCAGCHNVFPSSMGFPLEQNAEILVFCPRCNDEGKVFSEHHGFEVSASYGEEQDSISEVTPGVSPGESSGESDAVDVNTNKKVEVTNTSLSPGGQSRKAPQNYTKNPGIMHVDELTRPGAEQGIDGGGNMKKNLTAVPPTNTTTGSYKDLANHLINNCQFCKNLWKQGYNAIAIKLQHDQAHKHGAYALDHDSVLRDLAHQTMITSSNDKLWYME
jgi:hypothetical protein